MNPELPTTADQVGSDMWDRGGFRYVGRDTLGRQTMQVDILKEAVKIAREKKLISQEPLQGVDGFV